MSRLTRLWRVCADKLKAGMKDNQILTAGVWIGALGGLGSACYVVGSHGLDMASRAVFSSVTIRNREEAFSWVTEWVAEHDASFVTSNRLQLRVAPSATAVANPHYDARSADAAGESSLLFEPGSGVHLFAFRGRPILLFREARETITSGFDRTPFTPELLTLWSVGGSTVLREFVAECRSAAGAKDAGSTSVYAPEMDSWRRVTVRPKRPEASLILPEGRYQEMLEDARRFLASGTRYAELGIPYRRGYLLHGPPGSGKSSLVTTLAGALNLSICPVNLRGRGVDDTALSALLRDSPPRSIILLEDVDCVFRGRRQADAASGSDGGMRVTFSGLLNALDGVAAQEGRLLVMTTNHAEHLDPALFRPGRCDLRLELTHATPAQARALFCRFYPGCGEAAAASFEEAASGGSAVSMAALQAHLLRHATPEAAVEHRLDILNDRLSKEC